MDHGVFWAVRELVPVFLICGPILGVLLLLNLRERRERALLGALTAQLDAGLLRSSIAIRVRCSLLLPRGRVVLVVHMLSREEILDVLDRLWRVVPHSIRVAVDEGMDGGVAPEGAATSGRRRRVEQSRLNRAPA